ncbi:MAG: hypothetical protein JNM78_02585 [Cyclobacteriaceae bacterium]|nr:hypothetical protein [Cyclobacteriaceae bacterium]
MTAFTGFTLITKKEVVDLGAVEINREERTPLYWSPITGSILAAAGHVLIAVNKGKK